MVLLDVWICSSRWLLCFLVLGRLAENTKAYYVCRRCRWHFQSPLEVQFCLPASDCNVDLITSIETFSVQLQYMNTSDFAFDSFTFSFRSWLPCSAWVLGVTHKDHPLCCLLEYSGCIRHTKTKNQQPPIWTVCVCEKKELLS